jgi:hypothetical protein
MAGQKCKNNVSGRTSQADYPGRMVNFSLTLRVKVWKAIVTDGRKTLFWELRNSFESRIVGMMNTYEDTNEKKTTASIP